MTSTWARAAFTGVLTGAVGVCLLFVFLAPERSAVFSAWSERMSEQCPRPGAGMLSLRQLPITTYVTYQGSGTRWARYMMITASGTLFGAVPGTIRGVPITSKFLAQLVLCIQTHSTYENTVKVIPAAVQRSVVLIRNPYEAILANFNRLGDLPGQYSSKKRFEERWERFVSQTMEGWPTLYKSWAASNVPLHVLVYSRMKTMDLRQELEHLFQFLNFSANIDCVMKSPEGWAHRKKQSWQDELVVFTEKQVQFLNTAIDEVQAVLERKTGAKFDDFQAWKH